MKYEDIRIGVNYELMVDDKPQKVTVIAKHPNSRSVVILLNKKKIKIYSIWEYFVQTCDQQDVELII